jgi:predicted glycosyltransferase
MTTHGMVWIDLANSPHVLFFEPVIAELQRRGVDVRVTARDFAQTAPLSRRLPVPIEVLGSHGGAGLAGKARTLAGRVAQLRRWGRDARPAVAVSHNSYAQAVAARSLGFPVMTAMDYEFQPANHLAFRCADLVAVPDAYPLDALWRQGARPQRTWRYPGLKEEITLAGFEPDPAYLKGLGIDPSKRVVVVRPPADMALYHRFENPLFGHLLARLAGDESLTVLLLPRTLEQARELAAAGFGELLWRGEVLDGPNAIAAADAVISAGGSMNREAAVLGTPACSVYAGRLGGVDRALIADGRLRLLRSVAEVNQVQITKKEPARRQVVGRGLLRGFVDRLLELRDGP